MRNDGRVQVRSKKNMKKSTKKIIKLEHKDDWSISNLSKCDRAERLRKGDG